MNWSKAYTDILKNGGKVSHPDLDGYIKMDNGLIYVYERGKSRLSMSNDFNSWAKITTFSQVFDKDELYESTKAWISTLVGGPNSKDEKPEDTTPERWW